MKNNSRPALKVIQGGRKELKNAIMTEVARGTLKPDLLETLKPRGKLELVHSQPRRPEQDDWFNFEDLNF